MVDKFGSTDTESSMSGRLAGLIAMNETHKRASWLACLLQPGFDPHTHPGQKMSGCESATNATTMQNSTRQRAASDPN